MNSLNSEILSLSLVDKQKKYINKYYMGCMEHRMTQDHKKQIKKNKAHHSTLT